MTRGDVVRLPSRRRARGHEQRGRRYGVIVQSDDLTALSTVLVVPTSRGKLPTRFRPEIEVMGEKTRVLTEQLWAVDRQRLPEPVDHLSYTDLRVVDRALRETLALERGD